MSETGSPSSDVKSAAHSVEPIDEDVSLSSISDDYKAGVPDDLRESYSCQWYLNQVVSHPKIARSAHQRLADMFDYYGRAEPDTEGVVRYTLASEDPLHDGEKLETRELPDEAVEDIAAAEIDYDTTPSLWPRP